MFKFFQEETETHFIFKMLGVKIKLNKNYKNMRTNNIWIVQENGNKTKVKKIKGLKIKFLGKNANVFIHTPMIKFINSRIVCGNNAKIEIKSSNKKANQLKILASGDNSICSIGSNFSCTQDCFIQMSEESNLKVEIGDNCMFGSFIIIRATDCHTIIDKSTKEILNLGKNVIIGNHVWLARDILILKGVYIPENCIVGACSVVTKSLDEESSLYVGAPAKKIKNNIEWFRSSITKYKECIEKDKQPF